MITLRYVAWGIFVFLGRMSTARARGLTDDDVARYMVTGSPGSRSDNRRSLASTLYNCSPVRLPYHASFLEIALPKLLQLESPSHINEVGLRARHNRCVANTRR